MTTKTSGEIEFSMHVGRSLWATARYYVDTLNYNGAGIRVLESPGVFSKTFNFRANPTSAAALAFMLRATAEVRNASQETLDQLEKIVLKGTGAASMDALLATRP